MKTIILSALLVSMSSFFSFVVREVPDRPSKVSGVETFRVHRQGKEVCLTWSASGPAEKFRVERSEDGDFFEPIYFIENNGARSFKYNDGGFFPGTIYYRIVSVDAAGSEEFSAVQSIRIMLRG